MKGIIYLKSILCSISKYIKQNEGSVLPLIALTFPVILGMVSLGTDASLWMSEKRNLQISADASVIAAGWELAQESEEYMDYVAYREATNNGYDSSANGELILQILNSDADGTTISIALEQDANTFFSKIIFNTPIRIAAYAEALITGIDGQFCVFALEDEDSGAVATFGSVDIDSPDCGIAVNSTDDEALTMKGNVDFNIGTVRISGDYDIGGSVDFDYTSLRTGQAPIADPYEDLDVPEHNDCDSNNTRINSSTTLSPGTYCGGINVSGNNSITFEPGVYIIDGGDFNVTGSGNMIGEGVTFILTGEGNDYAGLDISGNRSIEFSAPLSGENWSGITFFQDRNAPQRDNLQNKIVGTSDIIFDGVAYFPSQGLWFGGNTTVLGNDTPCTKLIARTVTLTGNPRLGNSCNLYDIEDTGLPSVKLIR
ncbi:MAG: Tad domain-containing protein [Alphaproteobacteria bacterium]|nr:Tad domain-containing protein [Alphaproteobacteria bacterium]